MSPRERLITLRLDQAVHDQLEADRQRFGTPISEQIRRALDVWLAGGGMAGSVGAQEGQAARKRAGTRKRA